MVPRRLEDALTIVGTCLDMCPRFERYRRERENNLFEWELVSQVLLWDVAFTTLILFRSLERSALTITALSRCMSVLPVTKSFRRICDLPLCSRLSIRCNEAKD